MKKFKVTVWSGSVNTVAVKEFQDKEEALTHFADYLQSPNLIRLDDVIVNPKNISFVAAEELVENPSEETTIEG